MFFVWTCFQFSWVNTWEWNCWVINFLRQLLGCFPKQLHHPTFPPAMYEGPNSPRPGQYLLLSVLLIIVSLVGCHVFITKATVKIQWASISSDQPQNPANHRSRQTRDNDANTGPASAYGALSDRQRRTRATSLTQEPVRNAKSQTYRVRDSGMRPRSLRFL